MFRHIDLPQDVLKEHRDRRRDQVLNCKGSCHRKVSQRDELCLLGVEVNETSDAVSIRVQHKEDLIIVAINNSVVS